MRGLQSYRLKKRQKIVCETLVFVDSARGLKEHHSNVFELSLIYTFEEIVMGDKMKA